MSFLTIYKDENPNTKESFSDFDSIKSKLKLRGIDFRRWKAQVELGEKPVQEEVLNAYSSSVEKLKKENGFITADMIQMDGSTMDIRIIRNRFLKEHTHNEDEARFFVQGSGLFYIHKDKEVFSVLCEQGDLINIPAGTAHWFDMGLPPFLCCIRLFSRREGWVPYFTNVNISDRFPLLN